MEEKLLILKEGEVIDQEIYDFALGSFNEAKKYSDNKERIEMFITHLAMATARIKSGDIVDSDPTMIIDNIREDVGEERFNQVVSLWEKMKSHTSFSFPKSEEAFIYLHLCNIFNE